MGKLKIEPTVILKTHLKARETIAFEAEFIANAVELAKSYLPAIFSNFKSEVNTVRLEEKATLKLNKPYANMVSIVNQTNYTDIAKLELPVCEGFESNLSVAFQTVNVILDTMGELEKHIKDFHQYVAVFLTNKDAKKKTIDLSSNNKKIETALQKLKDAIGSLFKEGNSDNILTFSKLFQSNGDFKKAIQQYAVTDKRISDSIKINDLKLIVDDTVDNLESVVKLLKEDKIDNVSPETVKSLSEGSYQVALAAEGYSIAYFKVLAIMNIVPGFENYINESLISKK
jgi:hypothetical protein